MGVESKYNNLEIKYALRSIDRYILGYRKIVIISPRIPNFLYKNDQLELVELNEERCNRQSRVQRKIEWALRNLDITEDFAYWNDDFLVLKPFDIRYMPNYISGNLSLKTQTGWGECKRRTAAYLSVQNKTLYNFDIHVPMIFNKEKHLTLSNWWHKKENETPLMRSLYGNIFSCENLVQLKDIKLQQKWNTAIKTILDSDRWVISYGDGALNTDFHKWMESYFYKKTIFESKVEKCCDFDESNKILDQWKSLYRKKNDR